jgi:hypothetical protein
MTAMLTPGNQSKSVGAVKPFENWRVIKASGLVPTQHPTHPIHVILTSTSEQRSRHNHPADWPVPRIGPHARAIQLHHNPPTHENGRPPPGLKTLPRHQHSRHTRKSPPSRLQRQKQNLRNRRIPPQNRHAHQLPRRRQGQRNAPDSRNVSAPPRGRHAAHRGRRGRECYRSV